MKILFTISRFSSGGLEGVSVSFANGLAEKGHEVTIVALNNSLQFGLERLSSNVKVEYLGVSSVKYCFFKIFVLLKKNKYDVLLCFNPEVLPILFFLNIFFDYRLGVRVNNSQVSYKNKSWFIRHFLRPLVNFSITRCSFIIAQCRRMKEEILNISPKLNANKVQVVYNPCKYHNIKRASVQKLEPAHFTFIGRMIPQKNIFFLPKLAKRYIEISGDQKVIFNIVGDGPLKESLKENISDLGLNENFKFHGVVPDPSTIITQSEAVLLFSCHEGFPNVLVEAITLGTPIISVDCPTGPSEIVVEGENGFLIREYDVSKFAFSLQELVRNPISTESVLKTSDRFTSVESTKNLCDVIYATIDKK